jgi:hypothetical protein
MIWKQSVLKLTSQKGNIRILAALHLETCTAGILLRVDTGFYRSRYSRGLTTWTSVAPIAKVNLYRFTETTENVLGRIDFSRCTRMLEIGEINVQLGQATPVSFRISLRNDFEELTKPHARKVAGCDSIIQCIVLSFADPPCIRLAVRQFGTNFSF